MIYLKKYIIKFWRIYILSISLLLNSNYTFSQNNGVDTTKQIETIKNNVTSNPLKSDTSKTKSIITKSKKPISADFTFPEVIYEEMAVISNVLKVSNNSKKEYEFTVNMSVPSGWKTLNNSEKKYKIAPNDSVFIAVRLLTNNKAAKGGTKYNVIAFVSTSEGNQMTATSFLAGRAKVTNWQMHILPRPRIFFLNNENEAPFQVKLSNDGDEYQQVILSMTKIGKDVVVNDSTRKFSRRNYLDLNLRPQSDTTIPFVIQIQKPRLNEKRIDNYGYSPNSNTEEKHYGIYFKASEVGVKPGANKSKNKKVDFIKLASSIDFVKLNNVTNVNNYGSSVIPLTFVGNINNLLGQQPIMTLVFTGNTRIDKKSNLNYFLQTGYSYYIYNKKMINEVAGTINYNHEKYFVSVGSNIGLAGNNLRGMKTGRGISGGYHITSKQSVGGYILRNGQSISDYNSTSYGVAYGQQLKRITFGASVDYTKYKTDGSSNGIIANATIPLAKNQSVGIIGQYVIKNNIGLTSNFNLFSLGYSVSYLKGNARSSINFSRSEGNSNNIITQGSIVTPNSRNISSILRNSYSYKKRIEFQLLNNYNQFRVISTNKDNILLNNTFTAAFRTKTKVNYIPGIYVNYSDFFNERLISGGLQLGVNTQNLEEHRRTGFFVKGGYNRLIDYPELGSFFIAQSNANLNIRTWNLLARYFYGPQGVTNNYYMLTNQSVYSQMFSGSISKQQQFKNKHLILENAFNYTYLNINTRHSLGLFTQLFYYTNNGWQFNVNSSYNVNIHKSYKYTFDAGSQTSSTTEITNKKNITQSIQLGLGVKKDFAIPIPKRFRKTQFCDANLKAFLDLNGNKKYDQNEVPLENIVFRLNDYEVLSNEKGESSFLNIGLSKYKLQVLSLVDIGAWFPVVPDSLDIIGSNTIFIPFSQGVQILGNVHINREKYSEDISKNLDVSRLKIFLIDSLGKTTTSATDNNGEFKFYVPYGKYTLKFDEKILGSGFELLQNDIAVELTEGIESFYHTFFIVEKKRKVTKKKFDANGNIIENSDEPANNKAKRFDANGNVIETRDINNTNNTQSNNQSNKNNSSNSFNSNTNNANTTNNNNSKNNSSKNQNSSNNTTNNTSNSVNNSSSLTDTKLPDAQQIQELIDIMKGNITPYRNLSNKELSNVEKAKIKAADIKKYEDEVVYTIQVGAYSKGLPQNVLKIILRLNLDIESYKDPKDGLTKYFTGNYKTYEDALKLNTEIKNKGLSGAFIMVVDKGVLKKYKDFSSQKSN